MPNSGYDFNGSLVPAPTSPPCHFTESCNTCNTRRTPRSTRRVDDNGETLINKAEMGAPVVSIDPLGRDGAAVDYAIVLIKVLIESTSTGRIGKLYRTPNDIKEICSKVDKLWFAPTYYPQMELHTEPPERFVYGSGRVLQHYVDKSEWADYKARIETGEVKLKDVHAINRSKYVEAISCNARSLEHRNAWDPRDETTCLYENPNFRGAALINFSFVESKELYSRIVLGTSLMVRVKMPQPSSEGVGVVDLSEEFTEDDVVAIGKGTYRPSSAGIHSSSSYNNDNDEEDTNATTEYVNNTISIYIVENGEDIVGDALQVIRDNLHIVKSITFVGPDAAYEQLPFINDAPQA
ncbi:hypothetical protein MRX96_031916 [Rhipicephalus microplus]